MVASVPELTMRTMSMPGTASTTAWANSTSSPQGAPELVPLVAAWAMAAATSGWLWPRSMGPQDMT